MNVRTTTITEHDTFFTRHLLQLPDESFNELIIDDLTVLLMKLRI